MPECPVCNNEFEASGLHPHLRSHEKNELVSVVVEIAKNSDQPIPDLESSEEATWSQRKTRRMEIAHHRKKRRLLPN